MILGFSNARIKALSSLGKNTDDFYKRRSKGAREQMSALVNVYIVKRSQISKRLLFSNLPDALH